MTAFRFTRRSSCRQARAFLETSLKSEPGHPFGHGDQAEQHTYDGQTVYGDNGSPFHCSGCNDFFQVINIQSAAVPPVNAATTLTAAAPIIPGKAIILSASVLNVNGTIQSGQSSNYSVSLGRTSATINTLRNDAPVCRSPRPRAMRQHGNYLDLTRI